MTHTPNLRFLLAAISSLLIIFGLISLSLMVAPVIFSLFSKTQYHPQLPIAENADNDIELVNSTTPKQPFPSLSSQENIASGDWIHIPSLNVNVPLAASPTINDTDVINTLSSGAALYPNGIEPGRPGNVFIAAHSTGEPWKGKYRFAFLRINDLSDNNLIHLDYAGTRYTYRVVKKDIIKPTPDSRVISDRPIPTVTLMACWPIWSTTSRVLITGELTNITKLTPKPT